MMTRRSTACCIILLVALGLSGSALAQNATELYLPIGKSPGLSARINLIGTIDELDPQQGSLKVAAAADTFTVLTTEDTLFFLDKSSLGQPNRYGAFADLKKGMLVEVRFEADKRHRPAMWIKVQIDK